MNYHSRRMAAGRTAVALLAAAAGPARAQSQPRIRTIAFVPIEKRIDSTTHYLKFQLKDNDEGFMTEPQSQILVTLSGGLLTSDDSTLLVWLADTSGQRIKIGEEGQDSTWESHISEDSVRYNVQWENLRPRFCGRGVYRLQAQLAAPSKVQRSRPFVLFQATKDCKA
jgi:hypothetical protein